MTLVGKRLAREREKGEERGGVEGRKPDTPKPTPPLSPLSLALARDSFPISLISYDSSTDYKTRFF